MKTDWALYDLDTEDEFKFEEGCVMFKNSGICIANTDFMTFLELLDTKDINEIVTKEFKDVAGVTKNSDYLDEVDYTYLESCDGKFNYIIHFNESNGFNLTVIEFEGNLVGTIVFTEDGLAELRP